MEYRQEDSRARISVWRAPDLNCVQMRQLWEFKDASNKVTDTSDLFVFAIDRGDPDPSLFRAPTDYEDVPYSEHYLREMLRAGKTSDPEAVARYAKPDENYRRHRITDLSSLGKTPRRYSE